MAAYEIVAYGPGKSCLTWAKNEDEVTFKVNELIQEGFTIIQLRKEEK